MTLNRFIHRFGGRYSRYMNEKYRRAIAGLDEKKCEMQSAENRFLGVDRIAAEINI